MFDLNVGGHVIQVRKIHRWDFTPLHHDVLSQLQYDGERLLVPNPRWSCSYLGAGEEKAVYCVCDHEHQVFALELIDERHYLNGRFVGGEYFFSKRIPSLANVKARSDSEFGLLFTGLVKAREFVHGYEWMRFQFDARKQTVLDVFLTALLQSCLTAKFHQYQAHYRDVHERNVLFEIREFDQLGIPVILKTWTGHLKAAKVGLQAIDVR